jgi:hypothetical protein
MKFDRQVEDQERTKRSRPRQRRTQKKRTLSRTPSLDALPAAALGQRGHALRATAH